MRNRLTTGPHPALVESVSAPGLERDVALLWPYMMQAHLAHAVILRETRIISGYAANQLIGGLLELRNAGPRVLDYDPELEDLYFNIEKRLSDVLGGDVAGWLQIGRSRNDHYACVARLWVRSELSVVAGSVCTLRQTLVDMALNHVGTVMTGYTHQQPAQPITLAHYLLAVEAGLERDFARLRDSWKRVNLSPLGSGSMAGVSWPIDRERLAELLSFSASLRNSIDGVASRDFAYEVVSAFANVTLTISRLAADLQQFATWEYGGFEVNDDVAAVSSVMPQKKNPVSLEHCKGACAQVIGAWTAMVVSAKSAPYSHQRETSVESMRGFAEGASQTRKAVGLIDATLQGLAVHAEILEQNASANWSTATDLADLLVRNGGLTFRDAHGVVGTLVRKALEAGLGPKWVNAARIAQVTKAQMGVPSELTDEQVERTLNPRGSVATRSVPGGPAESSVREQIERAASSLDNDRAWCSQRSEDIESVDARLERLADIGRLGKE